MGNADRPRRVVIVGSGLAGTATAVRLLRFAREPVQVVLLERRAEYRHAGVAYHRAGNPWHHVFNIQAGRMSMCREDVDDFMLWANDEADRTDWPPEWRDVMFTESGPAPRCVYPDYLAARLAQAAHDAAPGVELIEADGDAIDIHAHSHHVRVVVESLCLPSGAPALDRAVLDADHVVLATGLETRSPGFAAEVLDHPAFVRHPYSQPGLRRLQGVRTDATVVVIGSLLSAYDVAGLLLRRGHTGTIHLVSRSGLALRPYPPDHQHRVLSLPPPDLGADTDAGADDLLRRLRQAWDAACRRVAAEFPDVAPAVVSERVAKAWEPYLPAILERIPSAELRALLDRYGSLIATLRIGAMAHITDPVHAAMGEGGRIVRSVGRVEEIRRGRAGMLVVCIGGGSSLRTIEADLVVSNFARESDYERVDSVLWANLLANKIACAHRRTGRGIEVDAQGRVVGPAGSACGPIWAVGSPREGDELVRHGRTGAFTFNLAAIKNHSVAVAATVLRHLESCYDDEPDERTRALVDSSMTELRHAVMLEVRRMAARQYHERHSLSEEIEGSLQAVRAIVTNGGGVVPAESALRSAVNVAATTKLTDLSVTPRELRALLGLHQNGRIG